MKTRFEQIKNMNEEEITRFFCKFTEAVLELAEIDDLCNYCPASKYCKIGHTGYADWLKEDGYEQNI